MTNEVAFGPIGLVGLVPLLRQQPAPVSLEPVRAYSNPFQPPLPAAAARRAATFLPRACGVDDKGFSGKLPLLVSCGLQGGKGLSIGFGWCSMRKGARLGRMVQVRSQGP